MNLEALLICNVSEGLFPEERAVSFHTSDGSKVELFVTERRITEDKLEVTILDEKNDLVLIKLPAEPLNDSSVVTVRNEIIKRLIAA
jgi:hypothetical protein